MQGNTICTSTHSMILPIGSVITNTINQPKYVNSVHAYLASDISQSTRENIQKVNKLS
jgi:hypothetical protein